jgi:hypothetical protein
VRVSWVEEGLRIDGEIEREGERDRPAVQPVLELLDLSFVATYFLDRLRSIPRRPKLSRCVRDFEAIAISALTSSKSKRTQEQQKCGNIGWSETALTRRHFHPSPSLVSSPFSQVPSPQPE